MILDQFLNLEGISIQGYRHQHSLHLRE